MTTVRVLWKAACWIFIGGVGATFVFNLFNCFLDITDKFIDFENGNQLFFPRTDNIWLALVSPHYMLSERKWDRLQDISEALACLFYFISFALFYPSLIIGALVDTLWLIVEAIQTAIRAIRRIFS